MKPTCDLCTRPATRHYHPGDHARCGLHEYNDRASVPSGTSVALTRRPPPLSTATLDGVATVRPPADERCPRCSRILIAVPCGCLSAAQRWVALQQEADALWRAMSSAEHVEAVRLKAAARATVQGPTEVQSCT